MKLGELSRDNCIYCGKGYDFCTCDPTLRLGFEVPNQPSIQGVNDGSMSAKEAEGHIVRGPLSVPFNPNHPVVIAQNKQAFALLYETLQEVRDIIHRGIRDGKKGHKRALLKAQEKLRGVE